MDVEFKIISDHLGWDDPAISPAIEKYTSSFWPFGRREKAQQKLEEKQEKLLENNNLQKNSHLGVTILEVKGVETEEEAWERVKSFKENLDEFYRNEFGLDEPLEVAVRDKAAVH